MKNSKISMVNMRNEIFAFCSLVKFCGCVCILVLTCAAGRADSVIAMHDWDPDPGPGGWSSLYGWTSLATPVSGGNPDGFLQVTFPVTSLDPPDSWNDIVYTSADSLFAGTWEQDYWFAFDFFAQDVLPNTLQVRWGSTTSSYIWGSTIDGPGSVGVWENLQSPGLSNWENWIVDPFATEEMFVMDLQNIDWVGVYIGRNTDAEQVYGIDNFALMVPEPAEMMALAAALAALGIVLQRRNKEMMAKA